MCTAFLLHDHIWKGVFHPFELGIAITLYLSLRNGIWTVHHCKHKAFPAL